MKLSVGSLSLHASQDWMPTFEPKHRFATFGSPRIKEREI